MNQQPRSETAHRTRGERRLRGVSVAPRRPESARVTVAWTASNHDSAPSLAPTEVELVAPLEAAATAKWTCGERFASNWLQTITAARCSEVVLTADLGDDLNAKHRVLELAELLTFELAATQPLIRVRFLQTRSEHRRGRSPF
jgi:hypothetical protein